jgi:hypothetical protein
MNFIDECPQRTSTIERQECERDRSQLERLFLPPCTSKSNKIYWNKHCALCHGEQEEQLEFWNLFVNENCKEHLFYLSSWIDVMEFANSSGCVLRHSPPNLDPILSPYDKAPGFCKSRRDKDITYACMSDYNLRFRSFRNIFCAMCESFEDLDRSALISSCHPNVQSIMYQTHSEWQILNTLCTDSELSNITFPYKNVFCYLCNVRFSTKTKNNKNTLHYADGIITVHHGLPMDAFEVYITNINITNLTWIFDDIENTVRDIKVKKLSSRDLSQNLNISHLARMYYAMSGDDVCDTTILTNRSLDTTALTNGSPESGRCQCHQSCLFGKPESCCFETMVTTQFTCLQTYSAKGYLVINGCRNEKLKSQNPLKYMAMVHLCESELDFPVTINMVSYRNIFCMLCNEETFDQAVFWGFVLRCQVQIPLLYHMNIIPNIIEEARKRSCDVDFDTSMAYECSNQFTQCTYFGDQNIVEACEHTGLKFLKRGVEFCDMCRYPPLTIARKSGCTPESPYYRQDLHDQCEEFPEVNHYDFGEYKNRFCFACNVLNVPPTYDAQSKGTAHQYLEIMMPMQLILSRPAIPAQVFIF